MYWNALKFGGNHVINIRGYGLTLEEMRAILYKNEEIILDTEAIKAVQKSRKAVEKIVSSGRKKGNNRRFRSSSSRRRP